MVLCLKPLKELGHETLSSTPQSSSVAGYSGFRVNPATAGFCLGLTEAG